VRRLQGPITTRSNGFRTIDIDVTDEQSLIVTAQTVDPDHLVHVRELVDPSGTVVFDAADWFSPVDEQKTNAAFLAGVSNLNWPVSSDDPPLSPGRWTALVGLTDAEGTFARGDVDIDVLLARDDDRTSGRIRVVLLRTDDEDPALELALTQARALWAEELYGAFGLEIDFEDWSTPHADLAPPTRGDPRYVDIAEDTGIRTVIVSLTDTIDTSDLDLDSMVGEIVGLAGGVPGAQVPTRRTAIQVGTLAAAGPDGRFSGDEIRLLAETMAHETAHYLGLFHPVEALVGGEPWSVYDALADTSRCESQLACLTQLGDNLMFPFPVCEPGGRCEPQTELTDDQVGVMQRNVGVR